MCGLTKLPRQSKMLYDTCLYQQKIRTRWLHWRPVNSGLQSPNNQVCERTWSLSFLILCQGYSTAWSTQTMMLPSSEETKMTTKSPTKPPTSTQHSNTVPVNLTKSTACPTTDQ